MKTITLLVAALLVSIATPSPGAELESIFNGRDLSGWKGLDGYWSVQDGVIVGETTAGKPINENTFLVWQGGDVADFEFVATVRFKGNNSGVQYRSWLLDPAKFVAAGYQMDLHENQNFYGMLYGEKYGQRGKIALRGQQAVVDAMGKVTKIGTVGDKAKLTDWEWNSLHIVAVGNRLIHQVNGVTTVDVTDSDPSARANGILGLQLHHGHPMRVEFKDLKLRKLAGDEAKSVMLDATKPAAARTPTAKSGDSKAAAPSTELPATNPATAPTESGPKKKQKKAANSPVPAAPDPKPAQAAAVESKATADNNRLSVSKDFKVEKVYDVPLETQGSWVALTVDGQGRLLASDQGGKGLFRVTLSQTHDKTPKVEKLPVDLSGAQGLAWRPGSVFFAKNGDGLYRIPEKGGDLQGKPELLFPITFSGGEHGNHGVIDAEDGGKLFAVSGNHTPLPAAQTITRNRIQSWQEDLLLPRQWDPKGHARGIMAPGGWITHFDPTTKSHDLFCVGFRNPYDVALNEHGDLFTYDADMEWDFGLPWYRPTRICLAVSGGDYGWRSGSGKWPAYYEDSLPPVVDIGPGSPTGVVSGRGTHFPTRYQSAVFALDWTYGRILAIHLNSAGAGYKAEVETFVVGPAMPVTDAVVGVDGALYFTMGGRGAPSTLMRVVYTGKESTAAPVPEPLPPEAKTRRELEAFHGVVNPAAVSAAWPHLSSGDRFLRNAARVAIESQPVDTWADKVFAESNPQARITAAVALARSGRPQHREKLVELLLKSDLSNLPLSQRLGVLRAFELTFARLGKPKAEQAAKVIAALDPQLPSDSQDVNAEVLRLLVFLDAPTAVSKGMKLIADRGESKAPAWAELAKTNARYGAALQRLMNKPPPSQAILYAFILRTARTGWTLDLRRQYFSFLNEAGKDAGGASYPGYLANTREEALSLCSDADRKALADLTGKDFNPVPTFKITPPEGPGKEWKLDDAVKIAAPANMRRADFESGRNLFHAIGCAACHRFNGLGGGVGPDLTTVPNKFDTRYVVEAIINPSKDISDQYGSSIVTLKNGRKLDGLVVAQDETSFRVYSNDPKAEGELVQRAEIQSIAPSPVSQMPVGLINSLNPKELRDLLTYIMTGGRETHNYYGGGRKKK